jgi:hypothetical protein
LRKPGSRPGPQDAAGREAVFRAMKDAAESRWGPARAAAIEATLRRTADAVWKLMQLDFQSDDRPGFFLADLPRSRSGTGTSR